MSFHFLAGVATIALVAYTYSFVFRLLFSCLLNMFCYRTGRFLIKYLIFNLCSADRVCMYSVVRFLLCDLQVLAIS